jgi:hypothetical protein
MLLALICQQAFKFIFTSPTSAIEVSINSSTNGAPPPKRSKKSAGATRSHVASLIGMRRVTARSIAYVALQVRCELGYRCRMLTRSSSVLPSQVLLHGTQLMVFLTIKNFIMRV